MAESSKGSGLSFGPDPHAAFQDFAKELKQVKDRLKREHNEKAKSSKRLVKAKHINFHLRAALLTTLHLWKIPSVGAASGLRKNLVQHQKDGVGRMKQWQDDVNSRGDILADDMGMGKTVQVIAFLVERPPTPEHPAIIAVPPALMSNWMRELEKWSYPSQLNVLYP
ncbi:hypothetical protein BCR34DRAFT_600883 [Clohesyomyces aquaticus]|uniref:SNF2 N-terminal domain-containing protein n=1 Tax=Clohesyomyces aquaticus TaxID=1231657 RepID=A0A1Y1ZPH7_9PLEO|nr:hypothetical protein BCR34DRAFT_600883 [Clohesyomyces aquaticus]